MQDLADATDPPYALLRCPPGRYRNATALEASSRQLRAHWRRLVDLGYSAPDAATIPVAARRAAQRGFLTYESRLWPRPAHCRTAFRRRPGPRRIVDEPPGTCEPDGTCDKYRISRDYRFIWHHVWKGGTTALSPYLSCNMRALPVPGLLRRLPAPIPGYLQLGTAREPLRRFLSAFQEVFSRERLRPPVSGNGGRCWHKHVPWLLVSMSHAPSPHRAACAQPGVPPSADALRSTFRQFVSDVECGTYFENVEHLYSQALFLGGNTSVPQPLDMLLRLESIEDDLAALKHRVGYERADACALKVERSAAEKPAAVPTAAVLEELLRAEPALLQSVCNIYVQDFICLGYELPSPCRLLPEAAAKPPPTQHISEEELPRAPAVAGRQKRKRARSRQRGEVGLGGGEG